MTNITPILKKPGLEAESAFSYCSVSNLKFLFKIIERLVCRQLTSYLHEHRLLSPLQSAYRQHHSTETATLKVASDIFDFADSVQVTLLYLLDFSAAFDTVDHDILLRRLNFSHGTGGTALSWVRSFLSGRSQVINFAGAICLLSFNMCSTSRVRLRPTVVQLFLYGCY